MLVRVIFSAVTLLQMATVILDSNSILSGFITLPYEIGSGHAIFGDSVTLWESMSRCI